MMIISRIALISLIVLSSLKSYSQIQFGATVGAQIPTGDFHLGTKSGIGFDFQGKYWFPGNIAVGMNIGYHPFNTTVSGIDFTIIPFTGLIEYRFGNERVAPYIGGQLGAYDCITRFDVMGLTEKDSKVYFGLAPIGGLLYRVNDRVSLNANLKYHLVVMEGINTTWLGLNGGVIFWLR